MATRTLSVSPEDRFDLWYKHPLDVLKKQEPHDHGACAIAALMIAMPLYERVYRFALANDPSLNDRPQWIMNDLGLKSKDEAKLFWNVFRDGLCHTGSFFEESERSQNEGWTLPKIGLDAKYPDFPTFAKTKEGKDVIIVNPWKFVEHVLKKYENNVGLLEYAPAPLLALHYLVEEKEISRPT